jgi:hypothetical protein
MPKGDDKKIDKKSPTSVENGKRSFEGRRGGGGRVRSTKANASAKQQQNRNADVTESAFVVKF